MTNVDWSEITKFSNMAMDWWDEEGPMKPLHQLNPVRLSYVAQNATIKGQNALDLGCGGGIFSEALAKAGANVTGLDLSDDAIKVAKVHAKDQNLEISYLTQSIEDFAKEHKASNAAPFELITCLEMIEHVPDPMAIIQAIVPLLSPTGTLFISTLNRHPRAFVEAIIGAEYVLNMIPKGTHEYHKFIRPSELEQWARQCGLKLTGIKGISYHLLRKTFSLSDTLSVNYLACFKFNT